MQKWHAEWLAEAYRVLPPGGVLKAFSGTRTYHRLAAAMEAVGFEDVKLVAWAYGSGFPKSLDISKALDKRAENDAAKRFDGWGTALKPSWEPVLVGRKPATVETEDSPTFMGLSCHQVVRWDPALLKRAPFNPQQFTDDVSLDKGIQREIEDLPLLQCDPLLTKETRGIAPYGGGVYLLYYHGPSLLYRAHSEENTAKPGSRFLYVGKSDLPGARTGNSRMNAKPVFNRLRSHAASIEDAENLKLSDFTCRLMVCEGSSGPSIVEKRLIRKFQPVWNTVITGFGNQSLGVGRISQERSDWDTLHPGRSHVEKLKIPLDLNRQKRLEHLVVDTLESTPWVMQLLDGSPDRIG